MVMCRTSIQPIPMAPRFSCRRGNSQAQRCPFCQDKAVKQSRGAAENVWRCQREGYHPRGRKMGTEREQWGQGGFIPSSHGPGIARTELCTPRAETKGGRKRNSCFDKHEVEEVTGQGIWAPRTFSTHKFSRAALKPGNLSWLWEINYPRSRQGQSLASSPVSPWLCHGHSLSLCLWDLGWAPTEPWTGLGWWGDLGAHLAPAPVLTPGARMEGPALIHCLQ